MRFWYLLEYFSKFPSIPSYLYGSSPGTICFLFLWEKKPANWDGGHTQFRRKLSRNGAGFGWALVFFFRLPFLNARPARFLHSPQFITRHEKPKWRQLKLITGKNRGVCQSLRYFVSLIYSHENTIYHPGHCCFSLQSCGVPVDCSGRVGYLWIAPVEWRLRPLYLSFSHQTVL